MVTLKLLVTKSPELEALQKHKGKHREGRGGITADLSPSNTWRYTKASDPVMVWTSGLYVPVHNILDCIRANKMFLP